MGTEEVLKALGNVQEPDLKKDLVTLNMVRDIIISENAVEFTVVLTTPACPMKELIRRDCEKAIHDHMDEGLEVIVNFTANTSSIRVDLTSVLPGVKNIIAVVSGKGGVGKSTVAANLALALSQQGAKVGLMDADIYGPSVPIMFGVRGQRPLMENIEGKDKIVPLEQHGIKLISIGLLVDEKSAVVWRGPMASSAIRQFVTDVHWGELDYLVIDMPPGTGTDHPGYRGCCCYYASGSCLIRCQKGHFYVLAGPNKGPHHRIGGKHGMVYPRRIAGEQVLYFWKGWR
jgi:ATP-binding protein involved in chromosome partitioning